MKRFLKYAAWTLAAGLLAVGLIVARVQTAELRSMVDPADASPAPYALVLGASVKQDGTPSDALSDRVKTGVELYNAGKVSKLLMSGDDGRFHVNEVETMRRLAVEAGVTSTDVLVDGQGYRTYESCKRATQVFQIKKAIIITQRFHLARALYLCRAFGMDVQGVSADKQSYQRIIFFTLRDLASSLKAWWDVNIRAPESPVK